MRARRTTGLGGLTPLLDTVFLLLFALLSVTSSKTVQRDEIVRVQLPRVEPGEDASRAPAKIIALVLDADGSLRMDDASDVLASRDDLDRALARALGEALPEEVHVEIRADRDARHGAAVAMLQHLRLAGFVHVDLLASGASGTDELFGERPR